MMHEPQVCAIGLYSAHRHTSFYSFVEVFETLSFEECAKSITVI